MGSRHGYRLYFHFLYHLRSRGLASLGIGERGLLYLVSELHAFNYAAEGGVVVIQMPGLGVVQADEELAAAAVGIRAAGH